MEEVEELISLFCYQTFDSSKLTLLHKTLKTARLVMADHIVLNCINTKVFAANIQKKTMSSTYEHSIRWSRSLCIEYRRCRKEKITSQKKMIKRLSQKLGKKNKMIYSFFLYLKT